MSWRLRKRKTSHSGPMSHLSEISSTCYGLIQMWMYTVWTPMNIQKQIAFRESLLWWKTWTSWTEKGETNFFFFLALSHPFVSKVMGSLTWCNESIINKIRDSFLNQVTLFRLSGYGAASLSHTLALGRVRDLYLWAFLLQPCKAWLLDASFSRAASVIAQGAPIFLLHFLMLPTHAKLLFF